MFVVEKGNLQGAIPIPLVDYDGHEQRGVYRLGFNRREHLAVYGDPGEHFLKQGFLLLKNDTRIGPEGREVIQ